MPRDFLKTSDWPAEELQGADRIGGAIQKRRRTGTQPLAGRSVALVFFNPSLRTRASMQVGIYELGGNAVVLEPGGTSWTLEHRDGVVMDSDKTEHVAEFVRVLGRYCVGHRRADFCGAKNWEEERTDPVLNAFAKYSEVPIINLESAMHHPCQALADMMTIREKLGAGRKKVVADLGLASEASADGRAEQFCAGCRADGPRSDDCAPAGYELDEELMENIRQQAAGAGGRIRLTNDIDEAFDGAEVVYAKSWGSKTVLRRAGAGHRRARAVSRQVDCG